MSRRFLAGAIPLLGASVAVLAGCTAPAGAADAAAPAGGADTAAPAPSATSRVPTAPSGRDFEPLPESGALEAGAYYYANPLSDAPDELQGLSDYSWIGFTVPDGWAVRNGYVGKHLGTPDQVALSFWTVRRVNAEPCRSESGAIGETKHPPVDGDAGVIEPGEHTLGVRGADVLAVHPESIGGQPALRVELVVRDGVNPVNCEVGVYRAWTEWRTGRTHDDHAPGQRDTVYEVDVDRMPVLVDASYRRLSSAGDRAELAAVLDSITIARSPGLP